MEEIREVISSLSGALMVIRITSLTFTRELAVVLPAGLVAADHAGDLLPVLVLGAAALVV